MGHDILQALFREDGVELGVMYLDCGMLIYDVKAQDGAFLIADELAKKDDENTADAE